MPTANAEDYDGSLPGSYGLYSYGRRIPKGSRRKGLDGMLG